MTRPKTPQKEGGPYIYSCGKQGKYLSVLTINLFDQDKPIVDISYHEENIKAIERRFNKLKTYRGSLIFDDYAHHPTEIAEVLKGVKKVYHSKEIISIFQPHRISRLKDLRTEF